MWYWFCVVTDLFHSPLLPHWWGSHVGSSFSVPEGMVDPSAVKVWVVPSKPENTAQGTLCLAKLPDFWRSRGCMRKVCDNTVVPLDQSIFNSRLSVLLWNTSTFSGQQAFPRGEKKSLIEISSKNVLMKYDGQILNLMTCGTIFSLGEREIIWERTEEKSFNHKYWTSERS